MKNEEIAQILGMGKSGRRIHKNFKLGGVTDGRNKLYQV
jgi:hypothetical protein